MGRKYSLLEKKKQKTFYIIKKLSLEDKSFLVLFFKKELLPHLKRP
jgi:hypothetical protein